MWCLRSWKRRKLAKLPFPPEWIPILESYAPFYVAMPAERREAFHHNLKIFAGEKVFIGAKGFEVTDEHRVVISAAACRLIQFLDLKPFDRLSEIVVHPTDYTHPEDGGRILGEAHHWGLVVLSWPAVVQGLANPCDGWDTAVHEFAHVMDRNNGAFNGTPVLRASGHYYPWAEVMTKHFVKLRQGARHESKVMRDYGATNEAEFFAVATEAFFERPNRMKEHTPDLFDELQQFYGFDPTETTDC